MSLIITITDAGRAEIVNAQNTGTGPVLITEIGFGTGQYTPAPTQTALQAETKRISTLSGQVVAPDTIHVTVQDTSADTYNVGEFGLYTDSGTLFAVFSQAAAAGWIIEKASVSTLLLATDVIFSDIDAASLTFGDAAFLNPPATTTVQGVVELATSAETQAGTDTTRAVTPKALADTYTAADVLNKIKTVDGSGSGLDADLLDGLDSSQFVRNDTSGTIIGALNYAVDSGAANTIVLNLTPSITALTTGLIVNFTAAANNTGATTINVNGLGTKSLFGAGAALAGGEIVSGGQYSAIYDGAQFNLVGQASGLIPGAFIGGNKSVFTSNGTFTVPANVTKIWVSAAAGGGGGGSAGGAAGTNAGSGAGGGGAGQSIQKSAVTVTPADSISITIGAAGAGGPVNASGGDGTAGTAGGNTIIGTLTLTGGAGGGPGLNSASGGGIGGVGYPTGSDGQDVNAGTLGTGSGGPGASSPFGGGGGLGRSGVGGGGAGHDAFGYGSGGGGGGGAVTAGNGNGGNGGAGTPGIVIIEW